MSALRLIRRLAVLGAAAATAAALTTTPAAAADSWSGSRGTATAAGTTQVEKGTWKVTVTISGELANTGTGCYSVWEERVYDMGPGAAVEHVTQCGTGSAPISVTSSYFAVPMYYVRLRLCAGQESLLDCEVIIP